MPSRLAYAIAAAVLATEVGIAVYVHDSLVRPYIGDVLAVILVYLGLRAVTPLSVRMAVLLSLAIATVIEFAQLFHVLNAVGLGHSRVARIVLGGAFDLEDLACYGAGAAVVLAAEYLRKRRAV